MKQYQVTGMSCAACSARVEKAVSAVPGVTACSVSLLTNSMGVEGTAPPAAVVAAVKKAGYGASPADGGSAAAPANALEDTQTPALLRRLVPWFPTHPAGRQVSCRYRDHRYRQRH